MYIYFFHVASATATIYDLSRGLLGLKYDQINSSHSDSDSLGNSAIEYRCASFQMSTFPT